MKIYDANEDYFEKGTRHEDDWCDYIDWKDLISEGFTHILLHEVIYPMSKWGPSSRLGIPIPYRVVS